MLVAVRLRSGVFFIIRLINGSAEKSALYLRIFWENPVVLLKNAHLLREKESLATQ